jgi:hypothetical protein
MSESKCDQNHNKHQPELYSDWPPTPHSTPAEIKLISRLKNKYKTYSDYILESIKGRSFISFKLEKNLTKLQHKFMEAWVQLEHLKNVQYDFIHSSTAKQISSKIIKLERTKLKSLLLQIEELETDIAKLETNIDIFITPAIRKRIVHHHKKRADLVASRLVFTVKQAWIIYPDGFDKMDNSTYKMFKHSRKKFRPYQDQIAHGLITTIAEQNDKIDIKELTKIITGTTKMGQIFMYTKDFPNNKKTTVWSRWVKTLNLM